MSKLKNGYKKIKENVISSYKNIESTFVDTFLRKDNETIEIAKARLQKEQEENKKKNEEINKRNGVM